MSRVLPLLLLLGACNGAATNEMASDESVGPANAVASPTAGNAGAAENEAEAAVPPDDPGLAEMSPSRRRAWEQGYRDCSAGRYDPDPYPEAYRIGCGAAQERESR